ncbi:MAG: hypothetical protein SFY92_08320 [Verrucomicrobiae bacterium]|nr:hypothetical protein [Verrucomicrobiae bacterium]
MPPPCPSLSHTRLLAGTWLLAVLLFGWTSWHHEMWMDEISVWQLAVESGSWRELIDNTRGLGQHPLWFFLIYPLSRLTPSPGIMQGLQVLLYSVSAGLVLFKSPWSLSNRILLPFGFLIIFEYGIINRHYGLTVLFLLLSCHLLNERSLQKPTLFFLSLSGLVLSGLFASFLAAGLMVCHWLILHSRGQSWKTLPFFNSPSSLAGSLCLFLSLALCVWYLLGGHATDATTFDQPLDLAQFFRTWGAVGTSLFPVPGLTASFWNTNLLSSPSLQILLGLFLAGYFLMAFRSHTPTFGLLLSGGGLIFAFLFAVQY